MSEGPITGRLRSSGRRMGNLKFGGGKAGDGVAPLLSEESVSFDTNEFVPKEAELERTSTESQTMIANYSLHLLRTNDNPIMSRRRPIVKLRALYASRRARATSLADGPGYLYAFVDRGRYWKLGMTSDFERRKAQWDNECPRVHRRWLPPVRVTRRRRAGPNAIALIDFGPGRRTHIEIFVFRGHWNWTWRIVIRPLLLRVAVQMFSRLDAHTDVSRHPDTSDNIDIQVSRPQ
ncbi:hypothetical protein DFH05DRAFT_1456654 [Lentinula detonsa]|uniref:Uncharacterized protein n=1 Tax=Lentinula detonsa TaxID=2804962 RepID=A0A9W8U163_9AGAR|nr:hypothetical protein DFH05DRAFT_1456654 [Lentinula detonsa]